MRTLGSVCAWLLVVAACAGDTPSHASGGKGGSSAGTMAGGASGASGSGSGGMAGSGSGGTLVQAGGTTGGSANPIGTPDAGGTLGPGGCGPVDTTSKCADPAMQGSPPPPPAFAGTCPMIKRYDALAGGDAVNHIQSVSGDRTFYFVAPDNPCPGEKFPLIFLWHWIGGSGKDWLSFVTQDLVNEYRFVAVMADGTRAPFKWAFTVLDALVVEQDLKLFDDLFACIAQQYDINLGCVTSLGVSAGGLFNSQVIQSRGKWLSSAIVISGGTGAVVLPWVGSQHKMPVIAFWGGPKDNLAGFSFDVLMKDMEAGLQRDGHYFIECVHDCGHAPPLLTPPAGGKSPLAPLFEFLMNHPYGLPDGVGMMPADIPPFCNDKGMGSAPPPPPIMCPAAICASPDTPIATPSGERAIAELRAGDLVYSVDHGVVKPVPLLDVGSRAVFNHHVVRVELANGRVLEVSGGHPLAENGTFADLAPGMRMDGVAVRSVENIAYEHEYTHDILPASDTGTYYAAGVLIGSTLFK